MPIRAVLWDADGVLLHDPPGWDLAAALEAIGGTSFAAAVFSSERAALLGEVALVECLDGVIRAEACGVRQAVSAGSLLTLWERSLRDERALAEVASVRSAGIACYLATNQNDHRRAWMRDHLGVDAEFDGTFYSCDLGVAKPDSAYFVEVVERLGLEPESVGFLDDSAQNVAAALAVGIRAAVYDPQTGSEGMVALVSELVTAPRSDPLTGR